MSEKQTSIKQKFDNWMLKNYYFTVVSNVIQVISNFFLAIIYNTLFEVEINYKGLRPEVNKNFIYASNHASLNDPPVMAYALGTPIAFIAKKELFENPVLNFVIRFMSAIPVNRVKTSSQTLKLARKALKTEFWKLLVFIEGTRSDDGKLGRAHTGVIFMAKMNKVPIVPVAIKYHSKRRISIMVGEEFQVEPRADMQLQADNCLLEIQNLLSCL